MSNSKPDRAGSPSLFGLETEYAYAAKVNNGAGDEERDDDGQVFLRTAMLQLAHLPGARHDMFLANGSRLYIDCGGHPELATPECTNPWQAVRYCLAGDQIMRQVAVHLDAGQSHPIKGWLSKCNVDYSGAKTTWGCHHSFLYRCQQADLFKQLVPHLVSRIVYSGAGGWNPFSDGLQFTLSPRMLHLDTVVSPEGIMSRGILNLRNESLSSNGNKRLHLQCGDSLESQTAIFLTMGTTALIVALTHAGIEAAADVELAHPLAAMRGFALDPSCRATAPTVRGDSLGAIAIQRHYLGIAEQHAGEPFMPPWTPQVCRLWRTILDRLDAGAPWSVADTLDWAIKYALYDRMLRRTGKNGGRLVMEFGTPPVGSRDQFLEADLRFGQVTETGLFRQLDQAGVLHHRVTGVGDVVRAMNVPPAGSRAAVRGRLIQKLHAQAGDVSAHWDWVSVCSGNKRADLSDPFCRKAKWAPINDLATAAKNDMVRATENIIDQVAVHYRCGHYAEADTLLRAVSELCISSVPDCLRIRYWRYRAWITTRRGYVGGSELLDRAPQRPQGLTYIYDYLSVARFQGLAIPMASTREWIERAESFIQQDSSELNSMGAAFLEHKAGYLLRCGKLQEALATFQDAEGYPEANSHIRGRQAALLGETYRRLGQIAEARRCLARAGRIQRSNRVDGDQVDYTMCIRAKVEQEAWPARHWLKVAQAIQERFQNNLGLIRTLLLWARLSKNPQELLKWRINEIRKGLSSLDNCEVFQRVWRDWDTWIGDKRSTDEHGDRFWGL